MEHLLGILINEDKLKKYIHKRTSEESLHLYHKYGVNLGIRVGFLTVNGIDLKEQKAKVYCFGEGKGLLSTIVPIPKLIHNRAIHTKMSDIRLVRKLRGGGKTILYNPVCSYKWENICRILKTDPELASHIPTLNKCSLQDLDPLISTYQELIIRSAAGNMNRVVEIGTQNGHVQYRYNKNGKLEHGKLPKAEFHSKLCKMLRTEDFIVQEKVLFDQFRGNPYLLHMSVQKDEHGEWEVSGIIGRVYDPTYFPLKKKMRSISIEAIKELNNISSLQLEFLSKLGKKSAEILERFIPQLSDLGISFSQTTDGGIRLIDANLFDKRIWYKQAGEIGIWEATYRKPIEYGAYLLSQDAGREPDDISHLSS